MNDSADNRRKKVLWAIVREFVDSAEPVSSGTIVDKYDFGVSPATVRHDMVWLEEQGLLTQPHTSAGRVPTEAGYRFFVSEFVQPEARPTALASLTPDDRGLDLSESASRRRQLVELHRSVADDSEAGQRAFAQSLAKLTQGTVFMTADQGRLHLAGISYLLRHPEFRDTELMLAVTRALDRLDQILTEVESKLSHDVDVLIGEENPFGAGTSTIVLRYQTPRRREGIIGLLGPQRMDYQTNYALMRSLRDILIG